MDQHHAKLTYGSYVMLKTPQPTRNLGTTPKKNIYPPCADGSPRLRRGSDAGFRFMSRRFASCRLSPRRGWRAPSGCRCLATSLPRAKPTRAKPRVTGGPGFLPEAHLGPSKWIVRLVQGLIGVSPGLLTTKYNAPFRRP